MRNKLRALASVALVVGASLSISAMQSAGAATAPRRVPNLSVSPRGALPGPWHLIFDGVFKQHLNHSLWNAGWGVPSGTSPPVNSYEAECYNSSQAQVAGGQLRLAAIARPANCGASRSITSGLIDTEGKFNFTYGYMEARIWLPGSGSGVIDDWPAFWAVGQNWPQDGEIDVLEGLSGDACYHFHFAGGVDGQCAPGSYAAGWHTYAADWEPGSITFYYDGHAVNHINSDVTSAPMFLILNLAVSSQYGGPTEVPAAMRVDWVKVFQH